MAKYDFEGDLEGFNSVHYEFISNVLREQGVESGTVKASPVGKLGDNYQAIVKRLAIGDLKMVAKIAPTVEQMRVALKTALAFSNEILVYDVLLPKYREYLESAGVEKPFRFAKCYGILKEPPNELFLFEDLNACGYSMLDRLEPLSNEGIRLVIKDLASLHACSTILRLREPELYQEIVGKLGNLWAAMDEMFMAGISMAETHLMNILDEEADKDKIRGLMATELPKIASLEEEDIKLNKAVLIQGDSWTNNILFKFEDGKPIESLLIDYQLTRHSNPLTDLNYLMFNCSDYETRSQNLINWVNLYHKEFTRILSKFDVNADDVYSREDLDSDMRRYAKQTLATSLMFNSFILRESHEVFDFKKEMENKTEFNVDDILEMANSVTMQDRSVLRLRKRVKGLIRSLEDLGYIL